MVLVVLPYPEGLVEGEELEEDGVDVLDVVEVVLDETP